MTASDFESEQQYLNGKRHLINRLIHGNGIVCGLQVNSFQAQDLTASLSVGVALDCLGREIIVIKNNEKHITNLFTGFLCQLNHTHNQDKN